MTKRSYFRLTRLPRKVAAHVDEATYRAVESIAERTGWNIPEAVRQCIPARAQSREGQLAALEAAQI